MRILDTRATSVKLEGRDPTNDQRAWIAVQVGAQASQEGGSSGAARQQQQQQQQQRRGAPRPGRGRPVAQDIERGARAEALALVGAPQDVACMLGLQVRAGKGRLLRRATEVQLQCSRDWECAASAVCICVCARTHAQGKQGARAPSSHNHHTHHTHPHVNHDSRSDQTPQHLKFQTTGGRHPVLPRLLLHACCVHLPCLAWRAARDAGPAEIWPPGLWCFSRTKDGILSYSVGVQ
eukprot:scaffold90100_cov20-Tisochrysis_lutea.AAC.6